MLCKEFDYDLQKLMRADEETISQIEGIGSVIAKSVTDYFKNEESIVYYEDMYDCCKKAEYYLLHEDERRQIAAKGHELVSKKHSYINRVEYILDVIGKMS
mgnify:CR=1 FL=1